MTARPYVPVSWGDEPVYNDKLNQMCNNEQWLFENSPRMFYNSFGLKKTSGVKIMAGILTLPVGNRRIRSGLFYFGSFFSSGSRPIVVVGVNPHSGGAEYSVTLRGVSNGSIDYRGFRGTIISGLPSDPGIMYIHFIAAGW